MDGGCAECGGALPADPLLCGECLAVAYCSRACGNALVKYRLFHSREHSNESPMDLIFQGKMRGEGAIYLGGLEALQPHKHHLHNIQSVVSAIGKRYSDRYLDRLVKEKRHHLRIVVEDDEDEDIARYFDIVADWIFQEVIQGRNVLVHCAAGWSRSVTLLAYYLMKYHSIQFPTVDAALRYIREKRPQINPNEGFIRQLRAAEQRNK